MADAHWITDQLKWEKKVYDVEIEWDNKNTRAHTTQLMPAIVLLLD